MVTVYVNLRPGIHVDYAYHLLLLRVYKGLVAVIGCYVAARLGNITLGHVPGIFVTFVI